MENSTVIFYDEGDYRTRSFGEGLVAHETAHQWFGDAATEADWHHLWLSEGFATYAAALWAGHAIGDTAFQTAMQGAKAAVLRSPASEKPIIDSTATDLLGLLNSNNYPKGSWVLHSLRGLIGDSAFFQGVRRYYREHTHGTALSADFARAMSAAAGQDLTWFFTQGLTQPGFPVLAVRTSVDGAHLTIEISQVQKPEYGLYQLPNLEVSVAGRTLRIPLTGRTASITTHWDGRGTPDVEVDPAGWWLFAHATR
jgi:aminopeptidase N